MTEIFGLIKITPTPSASHPKQQPSGLTKRFPKSLKLIGMSKQTAVDWLIVRLGHYGYAGVLDSEDIEQAKELEKQQIVNAVEWDYKSNMGEVYYESMYGGKQ
jgi:hypothetical protein